MLIVPPSMSQLSSNVIGNLVGVFITWPSKGGSGGLGHRGAEIYVFWECRALYVLPSRQCPYLIVHYTFIPTMPFFYKGRSLFWPILIQSEIFI